MLSTALVLVRIGRQHSLRRSRRRGNLGGDTYVPGEIPHRAERHAVVAGVGHKAKVERACPVAHFGNACLCLVAFSAQTALKSHRRDSSAKEKSRERTLGTAERKGGACWY